MAEAPVIFARDIPSAVSEAECTALGEAARGRLVLEMGSQYGRSTIALASVAGRVHAVDRHRGDAMAGHGETLITFLNNLVAYGMQDRVVVHLGLFEDVLPVLQVEKFEMIFVDGCHSRQAVERDIGLIRNRVRPRAIVAFHDYGRFEVADQVDLLAKRWGVGMRLVETVAFLEAPGWLP